MVVKKNWYMYWLTSHAGFNKPLFIIKVVQCTKIITIKYKHEPVDFILIIGKFINLFCYQFQSLKFI